MRVLVTGGAGFIGSHIVDRFIGRGDQVSVVDNLSSGKKERVHPDARFHCVDICSDELHAVLQEEKPELVFHLAAQADVQQSIQSPSLDERVNVGGTVRLLEACREAKVKKIVFSSTSGVYGDNAEQLISEEAKTDPISYYALSKHAGEAYIRMFQKLHGLDYTILRYANVYGPRQTPKGEGGVISIFMDRVRQGLPLITYGDGEQTRDFIYVQDVVEANVAAAEYGSGMTLNVSTATQTTVNQVARLIQSIHGVSTELIRMPGKPGDIRHSCLDNQKAAAALKWKPRYDIALGLAETYESLR